MQGSLYVVTGAGGQLGRAVTEDLLALGLQVVGCDLVAGTPGSGSGVRWVQQDLACPSAEFSWPEGTRAILHLAGSKHDAEFSVENAVSLLQANLLTVCGALTSVQGVLERFVYVSSISVYDPSIQGAIPEDAPVRPSTTYGLSKLLGEMSCGVFARHHLRCDLVIVRLAQVYGPGTWRQNALYRLIEQAVSDKQITLSCGPWLQRDYIHLDDARRALGYALLTCPPGVYNVGHGDPVTMGQMAALVSRAVPGCEVPRFAQDASRLSTGRYLDIRRFVAATGFAPQTTLEQGIRREVETSLQARRLEADLVHR